nr:hypothetical protein BaRGS_006917 [Batillaria attramentaria]
MDTSLPAEMEANRNIIADLYAMVISGGDHCFPFLEQHAHLLDCDISITHTMNCSCGRFFEQHPSSIDDLEGERVTRILHAIQSGKCRCLSRADEDMPFEMASNEARKSLLHAAAAAGQVEVVRFLLSKGCNVNKVTNIFSFTSLFLAICQNKREVVTLLLEDKNIDVNIRSRAELNTPLLEAILTRKLHFVDQLLAMPLINLDIRNFRQESPVIIAARMGHEQLLEKILKAGANTDARDQRGLTALMFAVTYGEKKVTKLLLEHGADINLRSSLGETPLLMAVNSGNPVMVQILLEAGANVNDVTDDGFPALMLASYSNYRTILHILLDAGANVHSSNPQGYASIHVAAWNGYGSVLQILLNAGAEADVRTNDRNTPLSLAAHGNHERVVKLLLDRGCNVNNADKDLDTPLHYAAFNGNLQCVEDLLEQGADPDALNRLNTTPLWNAVYRSHPAVVKVLVKKNIAGRNVRSFVRKLEIPEVLRNYITLRDAFD